MQYKMSLNFQPLDENLKNDHSGKPVILFMMYEMGLNYQSLNKSLKYDHSLKASAWYFAVIINNTTVQACGCNSNV